MSNQVIWGKLILETFIKEACLSKEEEWIMRTRVAGWSRTKQAQELHMSLSSLDKHIARLKKKYDIVQKTEIRAFANSFNDVPMIDEELDFGQQFSQCYNRTSPGS